MALSVGTGIGEDRYVTDRKIVRVTLLLGLTETAVRFIHETIPVPPNVGAVLVVGLILAGLFGAAGEFTELTYFQKLALRIPSAEYWQHRHRRDQALSASASDGHSLRNKEYCT
jgi:hypothetical protein